MRDDMKSFCFVTLCILWLACMGASQANEPAAISPDSNQMPVFSWDHVPLYLHIRKDTAFTDDEIRYLATFPMVSFDKATGLKDSGSVEAVPLKAARAVNEVHPQTNSPWWTSPEVLMYPNSDRSPYLKTNKTSHFRTTT